MTPITQWDVERGHEPADGRAQQSPAPHRLHRQVFGNRVGDSAGALAQESEGAVTRDVGGRADTVVLIHGTHLIATRLNASQVCGQDKEG